MVKKAFPLLLVALLVVFFAVTNTKHQDVFLSADGNTLFYNTPAAITYKEKPVVAYLSSDGKVKLAFLNSLSITHEIIVHDYKDILEKRGTLADDHAAPAVIYDNKTDKLIVATSYHGSDMHVFSVEPINGTVKLISKWSGRYTYPKLIKVRNEIVLFARKEGEELTGDLIHRNSGDGFNQEIVTLPSGKGKVVYPGQITARGDSVYFSYAIHNYSQSRMQGLWIANYNVDSGKLTSNCDLIQFVDEDYFSVRPTGIGINKDEITIGYSFFKKPTTYKQAESNNYSALNTVRILSGKANSCNSYRIRESFPNIKAPYYETAVAVRHDGKFLFFDKDEVITDLSTNLTNCFNRESLMYPHFIGNYGLLYASMNSKYSIREFKNSLYGCFQAE